MSRSGAAVRCKDDSATVPSITTTTTTSTTTTTMPTCPPPGSSGCCAFPGLFAVYSRCAAVDGLAGGDAAAICAAGGGNFDAFGCPAQCPTSPEVGCCLFGLGAPSPFTCGRFDAVGVDTFGSVSFLCAQAGGAFFPGTPCP